MNKYNISNRLSNMQRYMPALLALLLLLSCSDNKKTAKDYLNSAKSAYERNNFEYAKNQLDSIKVLFPKAYNEINAGFALLQNIRIAENKRNIAFCDSMLNIRTGELKEMLTKFDFVIDKQYQETGTYIPKIYLMSQSLSRNTVRSGVSEKGQLYLESVLVGQNLNHRQMKVALPDGAFAETLPVTSDGFNYRFKTLTGSYEIVRYAGNDENGVAKFIYTFIDKPITAHFIGDKNIAIRLSDREKKSISQSYELSVILEDIQQLTFEKEKSEALIRYLERKGSNG